MLCTAFSSMVIKVAFFYVQTLFHYFVKFCVKFTLFYSFRELMNNLCLIYVCINFLLCSVMHLGMLHALC